MLQVALGDRGPVAGAAVTPPVVVVYGGTSGYFSNVVASSTTPSGHSKQVVSLPTWGFRPGTMPAYTAAMPSGKIVLGSIPTGNGQYNHTQSDMSLSVLDPSSAALANAQFKTVLVNAKCTLVTGCAPPPTAPSAGAGGDVSGLCSTRSGGADRVFGFGTDPFVPAVPRPSATVDPPPTEVPLYPSTYPAVVAVTDSAAPGVNAVTLDNTKTKTPWDLTSENRSAFPMSRIYNSSPATMTDSSAMNWCATLASGDMVVTQYNPAPSFARSSAEPCSVSLLVDPPNRFACSGRVVVFDAAGAVKDSFQIPNYQQRAENGVNYPVLLRPKAVVTSPVGVSATDHRFYVNYDSMWADPLMPSTIAQPAFPTQEFTFNPVTGKIAAVSRPVVTVDAQVGPLAFIAGMAVDREGTFFAARRTVSGAYLFAQSMAVFAPPTSSASIFGPTAAAEGSTVCGSIDYSVTDPPYADTAYPNNRTPCRVATLTDPTHVDEPTFANSDDGKAPALHTQIIIEGTSVPTPANPARVLLLNQERVRPLTWSGWNKTTTPWKPLPMGIAADVNLGIRITPGGQNQLVQTPGASAPNVSGLSSLVGGHLYIPILESASTTLSTANHYITSVDINQVYARPRTMYHPMAPQRLLDSRTSLGGWSGPLAAGESRDLTVTETAGVPASATAVVLNVTVANGSQASLLAVYPAGAGGPASDPNYPTSLNFSALTTTQNHVTTSVGSSGKISVHNKFGSVDVVIDIFGYYSAEPGDRFKALTPTRILDSRLAPWSAPLAAGAPRDLTIWGAALGAIPTTATAVVANVTVTAGTSPSFLRVWSQGEPQPTTSNINFAAGQTIASLTTVKIGASGAISLANAVGSVHVIVDVVGYFDPSATGGIFHPTDPKRILDSRTGNGLSGPWTSGQTRTLGVAGANGVPADATGIVLNVTATEATADGLVKVFPAGVTPPANSSLNFALGQTIANQVVTGIGSGGGVGFYNHLGSVHLVADMNGYFAPT